MILGGFVFYLFNKNMFLFKLHETGYSGGLERFLSTCYLLLPCDTK